MRLNGKTYEILRVFIWKSFMSQTTICGNNCNLDAEYSMKKEKWN